MSNARFCVIPSRALGDQRLTGTDILVLNALGLFGDRGGWCWPSQGRIAALIGKQRTAVARSIANLIECGFVESRRRFREDGGQASNQYRILFDAPADLELPEVPEEEEDPQPPVTPTSPPCNSSDTPPCNTDVTPPVTPVLHQTKEPSLTPHSVDDDARARRDAEVQQIFDWLEGYFNSPSYHYIFAPIYAWLEWGADFERDVKPVAVAYMKRKEKPPRSLAWLDDAIQSSIRQRRKSMEENHARDRTQDGTARHHQDRGAHGRSVFARLAAGSLRTLGDAEEGGGNP